MDLLKIAKETQDILRRGYYKIENTKIDVNLSTGVYDFEKIEVYSQNHLKDMIEDTDSFMKEHFYSPQEHDITICQGASYEIAKDYFRPLILNTANALVPGGGCLTDIDTEEARLCRATSLYRSLSSQKATQVYLYNENNKSFRHSDYMLLSPLVAVIRDHNMELLRHPYPVSILSAVPVDCKEGNTSNFLKSEMEQIMKMRIRMILMVAARNMYRNLILTPFGCEEYGHKPEQIARYFRDVLWEEQYIEYFEHIVFAIENTAPKDYQQVFETQLMNTNHQAFQEQMEHYFLHEPEVKLSMEPVQPKQITLQDKLSSVKAFEISEQVVEAKKYLQAQYPFPECNYAVKTKTGVQSIGYSQGILEDGVPFVAELLRGGAQNDASVVFVLPYLERMNQMEELTNNKETGLSCKRYHLQSQKQRVWNTVLCDGMIDTNEKMEQKVVNSYLQYLIFMNLLYIQKTDIEGFVHVLYDRAGHKVVAIEITLIHYHRVNGLVPLKFEPFHPKMIETNVDKKR